MSADLPFQPEQELEVAMAGTEELESFTAKVLEVGNGSLKMHGPREMLNLAVGTTLMVKGPGEQAQVYWGRIDEMRPSGDGVDFAVAGVRCEDEESRRAPRKDANFGVVVSYVLVDDDGSKTTRRSLGRVINISRTGARVRARAPLAQGILVHMQIDMNAEEPVVAVGQVVRVVPGSEYEGGGFDVGVTFARLLQGIHILTEFLADVEGGAAPVDSEGGSDEAEASAASEQPAAGDEPEKPDTPDTEEEAAA
ncbi:MAG: hypothetical protein KatS3mg015_2054 [Fimbriimonadales bacterium]|nr:MAG: hypothetical protein KatS3mg015_2054 [Fimbriimonadales bacterium]